MGFKKNTGDVLNFKNARKEQVEEKRRSYERILFKNFLGVYTVVEKKGLHNVELIDISEGGISFQMPHNSSFRLKKGNTIHLRLYFSNDSYLPIVVKVSRVMDAIEKGEMVQQYAGELDKSLCSYGAVLHFVRFIAGCAEYGHEDSDHLKIYY